MYGRRRAILSALNFTQAAPEGGGGGAAPAAGAAAAGVAPDSAAGQALDAQAAAAAAGAAGEAKPAGYVPVGELAQERQKRHAAEQAATAAQTASTAQIEALKKALGISEGQTPEQLAAAVEAAKGTASEAVAQLAVFKLAPTAGGDAAALLDSASFLATLKTIDTTNEEAVKAAVTAAIAANPKLAAQKVAPGGSRDAATGSGSGSTKPTMNELMRAAAGKA
jgi:Asp-tRNA(Asn)/Glu-tRNA(Gln) amidotransferase B subunit